MLLYSNSLVAEDDSKNNGQPGLPYKYHAQLNEVGKYLHS